MNQYKFKIYFLYAFLILSMMLISCSVPGRYNPYVNDIKLINRISLTDDVILISDNQEHESFGTAQNINSRLADKIIDVASRPIQQEIFSNQLFKSIIENDNKPIIHLGDFLDVSCRSEFDRFISVLKNKTQPWVLTIGNHDGYFVGNFSDKKYLSSWAGLCDGGRYYNNQHHRINSDLFNDTEMCMQNITIYNKAAVIEKYLEVLSINQIPDLKEYFNTDSNEDLRIKNLESGIGWKSNKKETFHYRMYWHVANCNPQWDIERCNFYNSFLLQEIRLPSINKTFPEIHIIILDTSQYKKPFSSFTAICGKVAGIYGEIQENQQRIVNEWLTDNEDNGIITLFIGHHPVEDLSENTKIMLKEFTDYPNALNLYISGHTHEGGWYKHDLDKDNILYEMNVGSINDWPVQYRNIKVSYNPIYKNELIIESPYKTVNQCSVKNIYGFKCKDEWFPNKEDKHSIYNQETDVTLSFYKSLKLKILGCLLAYKDMLNLFPDGDVSKVRYARGVNDDCVENFSEQTFIDFNHLQFFLNHSIDKLNDEIYQRSKNTTREYARLADAMQYYRPKKEMENKFKAYQICQALWASERDSKISYDKSGINRHDSLESSELNRTHALITLDLSNDLNLD